MELNEILNPFGITVSAEVSEKLERFYTLLCDWNSRFNLTALTEREDVTVKHFADSLLALPYINGRVCDVGAGAGFPSVPLALANNKLSFVMMDSLAKRVAFLEAVIQELGIKAKAVHIRAEDAGRVTFRESFDTVTARAVAPLATLAEYLLPLVKLGGHAVIYKGGDVQQELEASLAAVKTLGGRVTEVKKYSFCGQSRSLVLIAKDAKTPRTYPRTGNKPRTDPITADKK